MKIAIFTGLVFIMCVGIGVWNDEREDTHDTRTVILAIKAKLYKHRQIIGLVVAVGLWFLVNYLNNGV